MSTQVAEDDLAEDQAHFDKAWEARESSRDKFRHLADAAVNAGGAVVLKKHGEKVAENLGESDSAVAIGRIDRPNGVSYVGRRVILDEEMEPLVIGWASPEAKPFYKATVKDHMGLLRKRSFKTTNNRIESFEETVFKDLSDRVARLTQEPGPRFSDVLLDELDSNRGHQMRDIVQTIHQSQYEIIERQLNELLIVQGGPGTGKTAVALHRVAFLLFNHQDWLQPNDILVVSPNGAFTQYIKGVLPGLGEDNVVHVDLNSLGPVSSHGRDEDADVKRLKGDARMAHLIRNALWNRVRVPQSARLRIDTARGAINIDTLPIAAAITRLKSAGSPYGPGRVEVREILQQQMSQNAQRQVDGTTVDRELDKLWPSMTPARLIQDLLASRQRLSEAAGDDFTAKDIDRLHRQSAGNLSLERWTDSDVALIDEAEWLINGRSRAGYLHIVVDEAQDLSGMQLRSLDRRSANGSFTLVGDLAQSTGPWARESWDDVLKTLIRHSIPQEVVDLRFGYRVPRQIFELARPLLALAAPDVVAPEVVREGPKPPTIALVDSSDVVAQTLVEAQFHAARGRLVGVIAADSVINSVEKAFNDGEINHRSPGQGRLETAINLLSPAEAKGLEFDATVVVEPQAIIDESKDGLRLLYISLTRSTRYMSVVHSTAVPAIGLDGASGAGDNILVLHPPLKPASLPLAEAEPAGEHVSDSPSRAPIGSPKPRSAVPAAVSAVAAQSASEIKDVLTPRYYSAYLAALADELGIEVTIHSL